MRRSRTLGQHRMFYESLYRDYVKVFHFLLDSSAPARRCSEFLKVSITTIVLSSYRHRLLHLTDTRRRTQRWQSFGRSVGQTLIGQARKNTLYLPTGKYYFFLNRSRHQRKLTERNYRNCSDCCRYTLITSSEHCAKFFVCILLVKFHKDLFFFWKM
jgi:hypothetical protein